MSQPSSHAMTAEQIAHYARGGEKLDQAIRGLTPEDLLAVPVAGKWSTQQVVIHLMDAELAFADRIRRIIAMDDPQLLAWDENAFAARLFYNEQSAEDAVAIVNLLRGQLGRVLAKLPPEAWQRTGTHSERGRQTLADVVAFADKHLEHHLKFINDKREALGKLMW